MSDWPAAIIIVAVVLGAVTLIASVLAVKGTAATEEARGKYGEQYRMLAADYEQLAKETRDTEAGIRADVAVLREKIESIEHMMREVG